MTNFEILNQLAQEESLTVSTQLAEGHTREAGGVIGMEVPRDVLDQTMENAEGYYFFLIIAPKAQYDAMSGQ